MTLKEGKTIALQLIDEFSNNDTLTDDEDIELKLNNLFNVAQIEASINKPIKRTYKVVQNIPKNQIKNGNDVDELYSHSNSDVVFNGHGKCYHFMVQGNAKIVISQENMDDIVIENKTNNEFKRYKGFVTESGDITITFTGEYYYQIKNVAIWDVKYSNISEIPNLEKFIEYELPDDFYKLEYVEFNGKILDYYENYDIKNNLIFINYQSIGEYTVYYYAFPESITYETSDDYEFEVDLDMQACLPYYVAGDVLKSDVSANYTAFESKYFNKLEMIKNNLDRSIVTIKSIFSNL